MTKNTDHADSIEVFLDLIENTRYEDLPSDAVDSAKVFILDTLGVALAGKIAPKMPELMETVMAWEGKPADGIPIWNMNTKASQPMAAMVNGYQCHALEYDCVYEPGVILPTPPILAALHAKTVELTNAGRAPSGQQLIVAFVVALEVSCTLSAAADSGMFFFRPTTVGVFSALTALCCLDPLPREQLRYAFGIGYSQVCGTMQAHEEGSMMLAMQMGFAARNAVIAHGMARVGVSGPVEVLDGRFGFYKNFEHENSLPEELTKIAQPWKVTRLSHKPFPSGRVTHGVIHAMRELRIEKNLSPDQVEGALKTVRVELPPLGFRLTGRSMITHPPQNYARLCIPFVAAAELLIGNVDPTTFKPSILNDPDIEKLARRIETVEVDHPDPNAFFPQKLLIEFSDGSKLEKDMPFAWGHPDMPLDHEARAAKFALCWELSRGTEDAGLKSRDAIMEWVNTLEQASDAGPLLELLT